MNLVSQQKDLSEQVVNSQAGPPCMAINIPRANSLVYKMSLIFSYDLAAYLREVWPLITQGGSGASHEGDFRAQEHANRLFHEYVAH